MEFPNGITARPTGRTAGLRPFLYFITSLKSGANRSVPFGFATIDGTITRAIRARGASLPYRRELALQSAWMLTDVVGGLHVACIKAGDH